MGKDNIYREKITELEDRFVVEFTKKLGSLRKETISSTTMWKKDLDDDTITYIRDLRQRLEDPEAD